MAHFFPSLSNESASEAEQSLSRAFASFTEAAGSLERSYADLQEEVTRLRRDLEVTNRDLTRSLEETRRTRQQLHQILESLPCGVIVTGVDGAPVMDNPESRRLLAVGGERIESLPPAVVDLLAHDGLAEDEYERDLKVNGLERHFAVRHASLDDADSAARHVYILRDISEQKALERERTHLQQHRALIEVSRLLAHEIRNPLGSMELFTGLLIEAELREECRNWVEHIQAGLRTISATVNNVLQLHDHKTLGEQHTDLGDLLRWAYRFLLPVTRQAGIDLDVVHQLDGVFVAADRHRLEQVILNLALNAVRYVPEGGQLSLQGRVRTQCGDEDIDLCVADNGPGISSDVIPRIFEAGFSTRPGSPGLGLAVAKQIIEQHGGTLAVESELGRGTRFHIRFSRTQV